MAPRFFPILWLALVYPLAAPGGEARSSARKPDLASRLEPFLSCLGGRESSFHLQITIRAGVLAADDNMGRGSATGFGLLSLRTNVRS